MTVVAIALSRHVSSPKFILDWQSWRTRLSNEKAAAAFANSCRVLIAMYPLGALILGLPRPAQVMNHETIAATVEESWCKYGKAENRI